MLHASTMHVTGPVLIFRHVILNMHVRYYKHACYMQQILTRGITQSETVTHGTTNNKLAQLNQAYLVLISIMLSVKNYTVNFIP